MNTKLLVPLVALALLAGGVSYGTFAFFVDTETSSGNLFTAGTIDLTTDGTQGTTASVGNAGFAPGETASGSISLARAAGTLSSVDLDFAASMAVTDDDGSSGTGGTCSEAEQMDKYLKLTTLSYDGTSILSQVTDLDSDGRVSLDDFEGLASIADLADPGTAGKTLDITVEFDSDAPSCTMADSVDMTITFLLAQVDAIDLGAPAGPGTSSFDDATVTSSDAGSTLPGGYVANYDSMGHYVAISGDTMVATAMADDDDANDAGTAYVFVRDVNGDWSFQQELDPGTLDASDRFGSDVAIDGDTVVVGAKYDDDEASDAGAAYVFTRSGSTWSLQQKLAPNQLATNDYFGEAVEISGDSIVVGAYNDNSAGGQTGAAYVYTRSGSTWTLQQELEPATVQASTYFGDSVDIDGDTVVVGASADDGSGSNAGTAYVFTRSGSTWSLEQEVEPGTLAAGDRYGSAVAVSGDTVIIGAYYDDEIINAGGAAYVFTRSGGAWSLQQQLAPSTLGDTDWFGYSVGLDGDTAVVGAMWDDDQGNNAGRVYVYTRDLAGAWTLEHEVSPGVLNGGDNFGRDVDVDGDTIAVGADGDDGLATGGGTIYAIRAT